MEIINPKPNTDTIWKYTLGSGVNILTIPKDYKVVSVIEQHGEIVMYCLVNPNEEKMVEVEFILVGTGWHLPLPLEELEFIGTVSIEGGYTIVHVFERLGGDGN